MQGWWLGGLVGTLLAYVPCRLRGRTHDWRVDSVRIAPGGTQWVAELSCRACPVITVRRGQASPGDTAVAIHPH